MSDITRKSTSKRAKNADNNPPSGANGNAPLGNLRNWCWTLNNYTDEELFELDTLCDNADNQVRGICYGIETGEEGTPHLQGYLELKAGRMFGW